MSMVSGASKSTDSRHWLHPVNRTKLPSASATTGIVIIDFIVGWIQVGKLNIMKVLLPVGLYNTRVEKSLRVGILLSIWLLTQIGFARIAASHILHAPPSLRYGRASTLPSHFLSPSERVFNRAGLLKG